MFRTHRFLGILPAVAVPLSVLTPVFICAVTQAKAQGAALAGVAWPR